MENNLFDFATSELTHDAILSWILSWGNDRTSDLYNLSKDFIKILTGKTLDLESVEIRLEEENIDIIAIVNENIYIIIEDKLDSKEHNGQLKRYKKSMEKKYPDKEKYFAYVTVGDEASYEHVLDEDYKVIERKHLIDLIEDYKDKNHILKDYYNYLYKIEEDFNSSDNQDLDKWTYRGWQKFFINLNKRFKDGSWSWVNNESGGFLAFYWNYEEYKYKDEIPYTIYMQIEDRQKIAFKVRVENEKYRSEIRNFLWERLDSLELAKEIKKPRRFGHGRTMTFAEIRDYDSKDELYGMIDLAERVKGHLNFELMRFKYKDNESFNFNEEELGLMDDIHIINGGLTEEPGNNHLVLVTNIFGDDLRRLMELYPASKVYIFSDEESLYEFKDCLGRSQGFLDSGYNMHEIYMFDSSKTSRIKVLSYFYGIENIDEEKSQLVFINNSQEDFMKIEDHINDKFFYTLRDDILDRDIDGFNVEEIEL